MTEQQRRAALEFVELKLQDLAESVDLAAKHGYADPSAFLPEIKIYSNILEALQTPQPEVVSLNTFYKDFSFLDGADAREIMKRFPNGLRIVKEKNDD